MSVHDAVSEYRKRLVELIDLSENKREACRRAGIHHSTYYRWRNTDRTDSAASGGSAMSWSEGLLQRQIVAFSLAYPALGPQRVSDGLSAQGISVTASKVWRTQKKHRINTRDLRYRLLSQHRQGNTLELVVAQPPRRSGELKAARPGDLVQFDCFYVGSFKETRYGADKHHHGKIWQYTAIDVASSWLWAELHASPNNPLPAVTSLLAHRVAQDLTQWGWDWKAATTDNGNEYKASEFRDTLHQHQVEHRYIRAGRPQTNGKVERVQGTLLEEFYQPTLTNYVQPSITGLRKDLNNYVHHYNWERPHRGKWNKGQTPAQIIQPKTTITTT